MILFILNKYFFKLPSKTSIIILSGGIGNQLFQYFLGQELKHFHNRKVVFYDFRNLYKTDHKVYIENIFKIDLKKLNCNKINFFLNLFLSPLVLKIFRFINKNSKLKFIPNLYFDNDVSLNKNNSIYDFDIYFGTWHTLINYLNFPKKEINLEFKNKIKKLSSFNIAQDYIVLHVRRGDYVNSKSTSRFHGNLNNNYFLDGVNFIRKKYGNLPVLLFSDDYKWLDDNLRKTIPNSIVISSDQSSPERDLFFMSQGKYFVLSNSTFSWWSAFLSKKRGKFIIVPKFWFNNIEISKEYIFKDWKYKII